VPRNAALARAFPLSYEVGSAQAAASLRPPLHGVAQALTPGLPGGRAGRPFLVALFFLGCTPELTEKRVIEDLGNDELVFTIAVVDPRFEAQQVCRRDVTSSGDEELDAAEAAGWVERLCKEDPTVMRLTASGRAASARWVDGGPSRAPSRTAVSVSSSKVRVRT